MPHAPTIEPRDSTAPTAARRCGAGFSPDELVLLSQFGTRRTYFRDTTVINEGDGALASYVLLRGRAKAFTTTVEGREMVLRVLLDGDYFGESSLFEKQCRSVSVKTLERCELLLVRKEQLLQCWQQHPSLYLKFYAQLSARVRDLTEELRGIASLDVNQRVIRLLRSLAVRRGDVIMVEPQLTQQDIADRICASRETVNRVLQNLISLDHISIQRRQIIIRNSLADGVSH